MVGTVEDKDNPLLLRKEKKRKKYVQDELFPIEKESILNKMKKGWDNLSIRPYVKVRDFNNGPDTNGENPSKNGYEIGIRFSF